MRTIKKAPRRKPGRLRDRIYHSELGADFGCVTVGEARIHTAVVPFVDLNTSGRCEDHRRGRAAAGNEETSVDRAIVFAGVWEERFLAGRCADGKGPTGATGGNCDRSAEGEGLSRDTVSCRGSQDHLERREGGAEAVVAIHIVGGVHPAVEGKGRRAGGASRRRCMCLRDGHREVGKGPRLVYFEGPIPSLVFFVIAGGVHR